jgi:Flp pilus assembly protein TadG
VRINKILDDRGAAAVEFAFILPLLLVLAFGIFEFGRSYHAKITLTHAAREGARALAVAGELDDESDIRDLVVAAMAPLSVTSPATQITFDFPCDPGEPAEVTITYDIDYDVPFVGDGTFDLESTGSMRCSG